MAVIAKYIGKLYFHDNILNQKCHRNTKIFQMAKYDTGFTITAVDSIT